VLSSEAVVYNIHKAQSGVAASDDKSFEQRAQLAVALGDEKIQWLGGEKTPGRIWLSTAAW
jgi:hypothetical protein